MINHIDNQAELDARHEQVIKWAEENAITLDMLKTKISKRKEDSS